jgi:competence protein ComEC
VKQALSVLVVLPDGRHILVDTGDYSLRSGCGQPCADAYAHLLSKLQSDLAGAPIDLMWITHQHSDHIGGATDLMQSFTVGHYVDNGRDLTTPEIMVARNEATAKSIPITVVSPAGASVPIADAGDLHLTAIVPSSWPSDCEADRNQCSILLRIDYRLSSVLFEGDAEFEEEGILDPHGPATLLQVGHHGSDTSSSAAFIAQVQPKYAVISSGKPFEGMNTTYCHPRASTVSSLTHALGGAGASTITAFNASVSCTSATSADWIHVPASDHLWATARDGDVVLTTSGDGTFARQ